jgi:hypothetical protein
MTDRMHKDEISDVSASPLVLKEEQAPPTILSYIKLFLFVYFEFTTVVLIAFSIGLLLPVHVMQMVQNESRTFYLGF